MTHDFEKGAGSRRDFLLRGSAAAIAAGAAFAASEAVAAPSRYAQSLKMIAEGTVDPPWVLTLLPFDPSTLPPFEVRARYTFPVAGKDVLEGYVWFVVPGGGEIPISLFNVAVEAVSITQATGFVDEELAPAGTIAMLGKVISNPVTSPFGDLTGRSIAIASGFGFDQDGAAQFRLLGGPIAGSHATFVAEAEGELVIKRPWPSY